MNMYRGKITIAVLFVLAILFSILLAGCARSDSTGSFTMTPVSVSEVMFSDGPRYRMASDSGDVVKLGSGQHGRLRAIAARKVVGQTVCVHNPILGFSTWSPGKC